MHPSFILFGFFCSLPSYSQDVWTQKADFIGSGREGCVSFSIGNKGYIGTGWQPPNTYLFGFAAYDPSTNTWTWKQHFAGGLGRHLAAGFSIGTKGYVGTGDGTGVGDPQVRRRRDFWEYDTTTDAWNQRADFGGVARIAAVAFSIGTKGYIGTGITDTGAVADFWEYNPQTNVWTRKADVPGGGRGYGIGFSIGNMGYVGLGNVARDFWEFDPDSNTWTRKADYPGIADDEAFGFSMGNKGYVGTGNGFQPDFWEYDPVTNSWTRKANFGGGNRYIATGFSIGTKGYAGTGSLPGGVVFNDFWEYTPPITGERVSNILPNEFSLSQNYPNPFNPSTVIRYQLPVTSYVTLKIYNLLGQEVATLVNERLNPGSYQTTFDGTELPSGVYFYRLRAGEFFQTRKLVLVR